VEKREFNIARNNQRLRELGLIKDGQSNGNAPKKRRTTKCKNNESPSRKQPKRVKENSNNGMTKYVDNDSNDDGEFEVKDVVGVKWCNKRKKYLFTVKWKGPYDDSDMLLTALNDECSECPIYLLYDTLITCD